MSSEHRSSATEADFRADKVLLTLRLPLMGENDPPHPHMSIRVIPVHKRPMAPAAIIAASITSAFEVVLREELRAYGLLVTSVRRTVTTSFSHVLEEVACHCNMTFVPIRDTRISTEVWPALVAKCLTECLRQEARSWSLFVVDGNVSGPPS